MSPAASDGRRARRRAAAAVGATATNPVTLALRGQRRYRQATPKRVRLARLGIPSGNIEFAGDDDPHLPAPWLQCLARARARRTRRRVHCRRLAVFAVLDGHRRADVLCQRIRLSPLRLPCRAVAFSLCAQIAAPAALRSSRRAGAARSSVPAALVPRAQSRGDGARLCAHLRLGSGRPGDVRRDARHLPLRMGALRRPHPVSAAQPRSAAGSSNIICVITSSARNSGSASAIRRWISSAAPTGRRARSSAAARPASSTAREAGTTAFPAAFASAAATF